MNRPWTCIQSDTVTLRAGMTQATLFDVKDPGSDDVLEPGEMDLVKSLQNNASQLELLIEECGFACWRDCFTGVPRSLLDPTRKDGDLDMLIASPNDPPEIAVLEFKRVKIAAIDTEKDKRNKLGGIATLFHQLEDRIKVGFRAVCGVIIVHGDLGLRNSANTILRTYTQDSSDILWEKIILEAGHLPAEAGLVLVKFNHPTREFSRVNFCALRLQTPQKLKQSDRLTDMFRDFVTSGQAGNYA